MALLGLDISNNNPNVDMMGARFQGVQFVVAKASQGWAGGPGGWLDWTFVDIVTRARAAGLLAGGYHWMLKGNGALQAQQFISSLQRVGGPKGLLCAIDIEENSWDQSLNVDPATVNDFLVAWDRLTGGQPILLYGASWYHDGFMHAGNAWPTRPLWWAGYTGVAPGIIGNSVTSVTPNFISSFGGWTSYAIRQFTDNVIVPAVGGGTMQVDGNVSYLTLAELQAMTAPKTVAPPSPTGELVMDAQASAAFVALTKTVTSNAQQLATLIQGVPAGKPNPFGVIGNRDLYKQQAAILAELQKITALLEKK